MIFPDRFQRDDMRFVLIRKGEKRPFEDAWSSKRNYAWNDDRFQRHLAAGGNYGILGGYGDLVVVDIDNRDVADSVQALLPKTFTVKSGGGGLHLYFISKTFKSRLLLKVGNIHYGEILTLGQQIVGPGSLHPSGNKYEITKDIDFAQVSEKLLRRNLQEFYEKQVKAEPPELVKPSQIKPIEKIHDPQALIDAITPMWKEGTRNTLAAPLIWYLIKAGVPQEETLDVLSKIANKADSVPSDLANWVKTHYQRIKDGKRPYNGISGLQRFIEAEGGTAENVRVVLSQIREAVENKPVMFQASANGRSLIFQSKAGADFLQNRYHFLSRFDKKPLLRFFNETTGTYSKMGAGFVKKEIEKFSPEATDYDKREVVQHLLDRSALHNFDELQAPIDIIAVENGHLNINTRKLSPATPKYFIFNYHPIKFNPSAKCPEVKKFIHAICDGDKQKIRWLVELAGLCLYRSNETTDPLIVLLYGDGSNGKSKYIGLLQKLIGVENIEDITLQLLETDRFASSRIEHKNAVFHADISSQRLKRAGRAKSIASGDRQFVEGKGQDGRNITPYSKLVWSCNEMPFIEDSSKGTMRRIFIIQFDHDFDNNPEPPKDLDILEKITSEEELSGFLNLALDGLASVLKNGGVTNRWDMKKTREFYVLHSDPVSGFVEKYIEEGEENYIPKHEFFVKLRAFCKKNKIKTPTRRDVGKRIQEVIGCYSGHVRVGEEGRVTSWRGIKWNDNMKKPVDVKLQINIEVGRFTAPNLESYGPYKPGDVVEIPKITADFIKDKGWAIDYVEAP